MSLFHSRLRSNSKENLEKSLNFLLDNMTELLVQVDLEERLVYVSKSCCDLLGKTEEELLGKQFIQFIHEEDRVDAENDFKRCNQPPYIFKTEGRVLAKHGWRLLAFTGKAVFHKNRIVSVIGVGQDITEQKLRESETRFEALLNQSPKMTFLHDKKRIIYVNEKCAEVTGYSRKEITDTDFDFIKLIHPRDRKKIKQHFESNLINKEIGKIKHTLVKKNGDEIEVVLDTKLIKCNKKPHILGIITDVSICKTAYEKIKIMQRQQNAILNNISDLAWLRDIQGRYLAVNKAFCKTVGLPSKDIIGRSAFDIWPDELSEIFQTSFNKVIKDRQQVIVEEKLIDTKGNAIIFETIKSPVFNKERKLIGTVGISRDITGKKQILMKLKENEKKYQMIFNGSRDAVFLAAQDARFVEVNVAASELTGYSREELLKMYITDLHADVDLRAYRNYFDRVIGGEDIFSEAKILRKDGRKVDVEFSNKRVEIEDVFFMHMTARDVTARKKAEEEIRVSLKEKEVLLKEVHHRVKNNMQLISSLIRLQTKDVENEMIQEIGRNMQSRINSMALIQNHLYRSDDLSKINLWEYIESLGTHLYSLYKNGSNKTKIEYDLMKIHMDINTAIPLGLICNELISNCFRHAFPIGFRKTKFDNFVPTVSISLKKDHFGYILFRVSDNGVGFSDVKKLGLTLVGDLVYQIDGTLERKNDCGTIYEISFSAE